MDCSQTICVFEIIRSPSEGRQASQAYDDACFFETATSLLNSAQEQIRTAMPVKAPPPQDGASTNFATWALKHCKNKIIIYKNE